MSKPLTCDLCDRQMFKKFAEDAYEVKVWRKKHSYDGYNPWVRKTTLDVCNNCMIGIINESRLRKESDE